MNYQINNVSETYSGTGKPNKIVMGFWHNWAAESGQGYQGGRFQELSLSEIPMAYNIIAVAFMKVTDANDRIPDFQPYAVSESEFRRQIDILHGHGRKVIISLGGADAHIELQSGDENALCQRIINLTDKYSFDGLDIDLEQQAITARDNKTVIPAALKMVKDHYRAAGKDFIISMAPEFPYLRQGGEYNAYIQALDGYYDFIAPQFYNQGGDGLWIDNVGWLAQNNDAVKEDFLYYLTESLVTGTRNFIQIPHDKFIIGLPANKDAAATGYAIDPATVKGVLARLDAKGLSIAGLMTWSVNWDAGKDKTGQSYNYEFISRYGYLSSDGQVTEPETKPEYPQWKIDYRYKDNELVSYQGGNYKCAMTHLSVLSWTPNKATSLWQPLSLLK